MTTAESTGAPPRQTRGGDDRGMTLVELLVAMAIMGVILTIVTGALVATYRATDRVDATSDTATQVNMALGRLDQSIRYADRIDVDSAPRADGSWHMVYVTRASEPAQCAELRLDPAARQLQQRTWLIDEAPTSAAWVPLASQVEPTHTGGAPVPPFETGVFTSTATSQHMNNEQVRVRFTASRQTSSGEISTPVDITFTAFNTILGPIDVDDQVCDRTGAP